MCLPVECIHKPGTVMCYVETVADMNADAISLEDSIA